MDLADLVGHAGVEKNALGRRRLARVDVSRDADIPIAFDWRDAWHDSALTRGFNGTR
jgi:hypothetical protein